MNTPVYDFIKKYAESKSIRFHMPGHKGSPVLGIEDFDVTEISGADVLYSPSGIIKESEENATRCFNTGHTYYSTEGSTLAIKAMLALAVKSAEGRPLVLAGRNAHKAFLYSAVLLDFDVEWIESEKDSHYLSFVVTGETLEKSLSKTDRKPCAVYVTTPDYLGQIIDVKELATVCKKYGVPLLVDNAHGAYLKFLKEDFHPITLGATACADSAHKTLPVLTGGAYLHLNKHAPKIFFQGAREALSLFASTSPSYLTIASLDRFNGMVGEGFKDKVVVCQEKVANVKSKLVSIGWAVEDGEPLKIVINTAKTGLTGNFVAERLRSFGIEVEYSDLSHIVLMVTPFNGDGDYERLIEGLSTIEIKKPINTVVSTVSTKRALSPRSAYFSEWEEVETDKSVGRIYAGITTTCPPAVSILTLGEVVTKEAVPLLKALGENTVKVVKN